MPSLRRFERLLKRCFLVQLHSPLRVVVISALAFSFFLFALTTRLKQEVSLEDQLDSHLESSQDFKRLRAQFPNDSNAGMIFTPHEGSFFSDSELCQVKRKAFDLVRNTPDLTDFQSPFDIRQAKLVDKKLLYMQVLKDPCEVQASQLNPMAALGDSPWVGTLTDRSARDFSLFLSIASVDPPGKQGSFNFAAIDALVLRGESLFGENIYWAGSAIQEYFTSKGMEQSQTLNLVMLVLIWICLRIFFGTWRAGLVLTCTLSFTMVAVYGMMALVGHAIDPLAVCLFMMITVASLEDFVFISYGKLKRKSQTRRSFLNFLVPSFFTSLTTVIGFGSLAVSDFSSIAHFGLWAAFGAIVEWLTLFFILPSVGNFIPWALSWVDTERALSTVRVSRLVERSPPRIFTRLAMIVFPLAAFSLVHLKMAQDPSAMFPQDHIFKKSLDYLRSSRGWIGEASLTFPPTTSLEKKAQVIKSVEGNSVVTRVERFSTVLNFVSLHIDHPDLRSLIGRDLDSSSMAKSFFSLDGTERATVYLSTLNTDRLNSLRDEVKELCPEHECTIAGEFIAFSEFSRSFIRTLMESLFLSLVLVSLTLIYLARSSQIKMVVPLVISSLWGPACMLACLPLVGTTINSVTCIVASTVVGLTGDNTIQYIFASRKGSVHRGVRKMGVASIYCSLMMTLISLVLLYSYFEPPRELGILFAVGFVSSLIGDLWILKGLLTRPLNF